MLQNNYHDGAAGAASRAKDSVYHCSCCRYEVIIIIKKRGIVLGEACLHLASVYSHVSDHCMAAAEIVCHGKNENDRMTLLFCC